MSWHLPIGYKWADGKIQVSESDAALVLRIFSEFNAGKSACQISKELNRENVPNAHGRVAWTHGAIGRILENPKYLGTDEYPQIIDLEMYLIAQKRRDEQREESSKGKYRPDKEIREMFNGTIRCGKCGHRYTYRQPPCKKRNKYIALWMCKQHEYFRSNCLCTNSTLSNEQLKEICVFSINSFVKKSRAIKKYVERPQRFSTEFWSLNIKLEQSENLTQEEVLNLIFERAKERYKTLEVRDESIQMTMMQEVLKDQEPISEFDERLYRRLIREIIVYPENMVKVVFHNKDSLKIGY